MKVEILSDNTVIGTGDLDKLDPPMGGANGLFTPTPAYNRTLHAGEIEGQPNERGASAKLTIRGPLGSIGCGAIWIADYKDGLGEIEVIVSGMSDFKTHFGDHPHYKLYYGVA